MVGMKKRVKAKDGKLMGGQKKLDKNKVVPMRLPGGQKHKFGL